MLHSALVVDRAKPNKPVTITPRVLLQNTVAEVAKLANVVVSAEPKQVSVVKHLSVSFYKKWPSLYSYLQEVAVAQVL
jgi:hypothetical protein